MRRINPFSYKSIGQLSEENAVMTEVIANLSNVVVLLALQFSCVKGQTQFY